MLRSLRIVGLSVVVAVFMFANGSRADLVTIAVAEDTAPYSFLPNLFRFASPTLYTFRAVSETGGNHDFETYLWFDVDASDVPAGQVLTEALLVVTYSFDFTGFGSTSVDPGVMNCHRVTAPWDDTTVTWLNRPAIDAPFDTITEIDSFGALICDATSIVQDWIDGVAPNHGFALTSPTDRVMGMHALEADVNPALKPTLFLTTPEPSFGLAVLLGGFGCSVLARRRAEARPRMGERNV